MYFDACHSNISDNAALSRIANSTKNIIIKIFDQKGKYAKTIQASNINDPQLDLKLSDLSGGTYVLNAFQNGDFVTAFKYVKC